MSDFGATLLGFGADTRADSLQRGELYRFDYQAADYAVPSLLRWRGEGMGLTVFLPSALPTTQPRTVPSFMRWSWGEVLPGNVLVVDDPTMAITELHGGWFQGVGGVPTFGAIAELVVEVCRVAGIESKDVCFHGSSLGGYGALMLAAQLPGSYAIAEVPQLCLLDYPVKSAIRALEQASFAGGSINSVYELRPHHISVIDMFRARMCIPNFLLMTNAADEATAAHTRLLQEVQVLESAGGLEYCGAWGVINTRKVSGHTALGKGVVINLIKQLPNLL